MVSTCFQVTKVKVRLLVRILLNRTQSASASGPDSHHTLSFTRPPCKAALISPESMWAQLAQLAGTGMPTAGSHGSSGSGLWSDPSTEAGHVSNTSQAGGSVKTKSTPLADAPVLSGESPAASTLHEGLRCLCSSARSLLNLALQ